jgi:hypothetical protein
MTDQPITLPYWPDPDLAAALERFDPPELRATFWASLDDKLALEPDLVVPRERRRPWLRLAAVAAAAAIAAVLLLWFGLPGVDKVEVPGTGPAPVVVGPEPATAAEVLASIERAYLNGTFVHGTAIVRDLNTPAGSGEWSNVDGVEMPPGSYMERRSTFYEAADGSSHVDEPGTDPGRWAVLIFNGPKRTSWIYAPEWSGDNEWAAETAFLDTGTAAGPPDWYSNFVGVYGYAGFALAAAASPDAKVTGTVYDGRPAWVLSCSVNPGPTIEMGPDASTSYRQVDRIAVTVDEETGYPLRVREFFKGDMWRETLVKDFEVLSSVPDDLFEFQFPKGAKVESQDLGFREIELEDAEAAAGYPPVAPTWLPADFALRQTTFADTSEIPVPGEQGIRPDYDAFRSTDVVSARYGQGFLNVTVTTRRLENPEAAKRGDPFDGVTEFYMKYEEPPQKVKLIGGAFKGSTASMYTIDLVLPHLWFIEGDLLVTVAGDVNAKQLVRIANSLELLRD